MYQVQCIGFSGLANLLFKNDELTEHTTKFLRFFDEKGQNTMYMYLYLDVYLFQRQHAFMVQDTGKNSTCLWKPCM